MKYWIIGILTIFLCISLFALLIWNIGAFAILFFSVLIIIAAYPLGKKVVEFYKIVRNE